MLAYPSFTHVRARAKEVKRGVFAVAIGSSMDANVAPNYTLDTSPASLKHPDVRPEGLVLTLKLTDPPSRRNCRRSPSAYGRWGSSPCACGSSPSTARSLRRGDRRRYARGLGMISPREVLSMAIRSVLYALFSALLASAPSFAQRADAPLPAAATSAAP